MLLVVSVVQKLVQVVQVVQNLLQVVRAALYNVVPRVDTGVVKTTNAIVTILGEGGWCRSTGLVERSGEVCMHPSRL